MEISGWSGTAISVEAPPDGSGQAIYVEDPVFHVFPPADRINAVWIHDNFIHHNQHYTEFGYGVDTASSGHALIERNVFDFNHHAITASGKQITTYPEGPNKPPVVWGASYTANNNLILRGGGYQSYLKGHIQQFDVHGDSNCALDSTYISGAVSGAVPFGWADGADHVWNCGNAGDAFMYFKNAFQ